MEVPTWTRNSFLQRKYLLKNPVRVIEKCARDFSTEWQESPHLRSFRVVPCSELSKCVSISAVSFLFFFIFTLSFLGHTQFLVILEKIIKLLSLVTVYG